MKMIQTSIKSIPPKKTNMHTDRKASCMPWLASPIPSSSFVLLESTPGYLQLKGCSSQPAVSRSLPMAEDQQATASTTSPFHISQK